jgi:hypothetical protein
MVKTAAGPLLRQVVRKVFQVGEFLTHRYRHIAKSNTPTVSRYYVDQQIGPTLSS